MNLSWELEIKMGMAISSPHLSARWDNHPIVCRVNWIGDHHHLGFSKILTVLYHVVSLASSMGRSLFQDGFSASITSHASFISTISNNVNLRGPESISVPSEPTKCYPHMSTHHIPSSHLSDSSISCAISIHLPT
jgi:hypothetical protein